MLTGKLTLDTYIMRELIICLFLSRVFLQLSVQEWALFLFKKQAGLMEFLLDRNVSTEKQIVEFKFGILKNCAENVGISEIFTADICNKIAKYVQEGPFHKTADLQIAFDEM